MKLKLPSILKSRAAMWTATIVTSLVIMGYAASGDSEAIAVFGLAVVLTAQFTKNPALLMMSGLFFTSLSTITLGTIENFEDKKIESSSAQKAQEKEKDSDENEGPMAAKASNPVEDKNKPALGSKNVKQAIGERVSKKMGGLLDQTSNRLDTINQMIDKVEGLMDKLGGMGS